MNYKTYVRVRNASWQCLIDCHVTALPVNAVEIATAYNIRCAYADAETLGGAAGKLLIDRFGKATIVCDKSLIKARRRFTIMHEVGHYLLGHLDQLGTEIGEDEEIAAEKFAANVLMPSCVLWGLQARTANDIVNLCGVSKKAAEKRMERLRVLYERDMFLTHPLERKVFEQFKPFIESKG